MPIMILCFNVVDGLYYDSVFQRCWWSLAIKYTEEATASVILCGNLFGLMQ